MKQHIVPAHPYPNIGIISVTSLPQHEKDTQCRILKRAAKQAFKDPAFAADYARWKAEREAK